MKYIFEDEDFQAITDLHDVPARMVLHAFAERHPGKVNISDSEGKDYWIQVCVTDAETQQRFNATVLNRRFDWRTRVRRMHRVSKRREQIAIENALVNFPYQIKMPQIHKVTGTTYMERVKKHLGDPDLSGAWYAYQGRAYFKNTALAATFGLIFP